MIANKGGWLECLLGGDYPHLISLEGDGLRRDNLLSLGVPSTWVQMHFPAVDLRGEPQEVVDSFCDLSALSSRYGRRLEGGEVGCCKSHLAVYGKVIGSKNGWGLVLEDDIVPDGKWLEHIDFVSEELSRFSPDAAIICFLGHTSSLRRWQAQRVTLHKQSSKLTALRSMDLCNYPLGRSHAYFVSRGAAKNIIHAQRKISFVADDWAGFAALGCFDAFLVSRPIFGFSDQFTSNCRSETSNSKGSVRPTLKSILKKNVNKIRRRVASFKRGPLDLSHLLIDNFHSPIHRNGEKQA